MEVKIRSYVDELFKSAPKCPKADEVKEEIYSNLLDKYNGLLEKGVSEQEAYENIKNSVGDVDELIQSIKEENAGYGNVYTDEEIKNIKKKVFLDALSLFLYICSVVVLLGMISIYENGVGVISFLIIVAAASAMRYYTYKVFRDDYTQKSQTNKETVNTPLTEEEAAKAAKRKKEWLSLYWILVVVIYLALSIASGAWLFTWVIFILAAIIHQVLCLTLFKDPALTAEQIKKEWISVYWLFVVVLYFGISFISFSWGVSWIIFIVAAVVLKVIFLLKEK